MPTGLRAHPPPGPPPLRRRRAPSCNALLYGTTRHTCMRRKLLCTIHTPANQTSGIEYGIHASKPLQKVPQKELSGSLIDLQLCLSA
jgi:hypothetical protein